MDQFPPGFEYLYGAFLNFYENLRRYSKYWFVSLVDTGEQLIAGDNDNTKLIHEKKPKVEILDVRLPLMFIHQLSYFKRIPMLCRAIILE